MPTEVVINGLSGQSPFNVYLCDNPTTSCIYINTITGGTFNFEIPDIFNGQTSFNLRITTNNGCEIFQNLTI
jgi:hypothetical protein